MYSTISKTFNIEYAHVIPHHKNPDGSQGKCSNLHGHSGLVTIALSGLVDEKTGMLVDYAILSKFAKDVIEANFDHAFITHYTIEEWEEVMAEASDSFKDVITGLTGLGKVFCLGYWTTAENISKVIAEMTAMSFKGLDIEVTFKETASTSAVFRIEMMEM